MKLFRLTAISIFLVFASLLCVAQTYQGMILGLVTDPTGAVVPGAQVTVRNVATGVERTLSTNQAGEYVAVDLDPGTYAVSIQAAGFRTARADSVVLQVSRDARVNMTLQPGSADQTIEVHAEQALAENLDTLINAVVRAKPASAKGQYLRSISLSTTMGPGINVDPSKAQAVVPA